MALVERLMHTDPDVTRFIPVHAFFAALTEIASGNATVANIKNYWSMTAADEVDMDAIVAAAPATDAARALYLQRLHAVFILAENTVPGYDTPAGVRTKLGI